MATHENIIIYHRKLISVSDPTSIILHLFIISCNEKAHFSNTAVIFLLFHLFFSLIKQHYQMRLSKEILLGGWKRYSHNERRWKDLPKIYIKNIEMRISVAWKKDRAKIGDWISVSEVRSDLVTICSAILTRSNL